MTRIVGGDHRRDRDQGISSIMPRAHTHIHCEVYIYCTLHNFGRYRKARGVGRYECDYNEGALRGQLRGQVPRWVETDFNTFLNLLSFFFLKYTTSGHFYRGRFCVASAWKIYLGLH